MGRDSTAIAELIKNSYDADATEVVLFAEKLDKPKSGRIVISDNGIGMTEDAFRSGFLRIASRVKEGGDRRSPYYRRRFTGAKGVGRLAAQKLAWNLEILSVPDPAVFGDEYLPVLATIDWKAIDNCETLDDPRIDSAIELIEAEPTEQPGTEIELTALRGTWSRQERTRVIHEVSTFQPPEMLVEIPRSITSDQLLFEQPIIRDVSQSGDPGFKVLLEGDFDVGEEYWTALAQGADWILEIASNQEKGQIEYLVTPTKSLLRDLPNASQHEFTWDQPNLTQMPSFHARVLIRGGRSPKSGDAPRWLSSTSGIRIYMEGFRVLPYGERANDWLEIDLDYTQRSRTLRFLNESSVDVSALDEDDSDFALVALRNSSYFGAVFLTSNQAPDLKMLVNREGFQPDASYFALQKIVRVGVDLSVRARAFETRESRKLRQSERSGKRSPEDAQPHERFELRKEAQASIEKATKYAAKARSATSEGNHRAAEKHLKAAIQAIERGSGLTDELMTDRSIMQILAGVGLQMAAFVHEMNALLGMATAVQHAIERIRDTLAPDRKTRTTLGRLAISVSDLRQVIERQASYLADVTSPDARRRRSRQKLSLSFDRARKLIDRGAGQRGISIENRIPDELKSPPMFPAELTVVFSNLLTNAVKACEKGGKVRATGRVGRSGSTVITIQNTGKRVNLKDAEKWFLPFKSSTVGSDPLLGQGMGMGLPIVRNILEEYGGHAEFVKPTSTFSSAIRIQFEN